MSFVVCDLEIRSWDVQHGLSYLTVHTYRDHIVIRSISPRIIRICIFGDYVELLDSNFLRSHEVRLHWF